MFFFYKMSCRNISTLDIIGSNIEFFIDFVMTICKYNGNITGAIIRKNFCSVININDSFDLITSQDINCLLDIVCFIELQNIIISSGTLIAYGCNDYSVRTKTLQITEYSYYSCFSLFQIPRYDIWSVIMFSNKI